MKTLQERNDCKTYLDFKKDFLPLIKQVHQILGPSQRPGSFGQEEGLLAGHDLEEKTTRD